MKKIKIPNFPTIEVKKNPHKKKMLAEVLVGAAIAAGVTYTVKKMIDSHHKHDVAKVTKKPPVKAKKKTAKKRVKKK